MIDLRDTKINCAGKDNSIDIGLARLYTDACVKQGADFVGSPVNGWLYFARMYIRGFGVVGYPTDDIEYREITKADLIEKPARTAESTAATPESPDCERLAVKVKELTEANKDLKKRLDEAYCELIHLEALMGDKALADSYVSLEDAGEEETPKPIKRSTQDLLSKKSKKIKRQAHVITDLEAKVKKLGDENAELKERLDRAFCDPKPSKAPVNSLITLEDMDKYIRELVSGMRGDEMPKLPRRGKVNLDATYEMVNKNAEGGAYWECARDFAELPCNSIVARTNPEECDVMSWMSIKDNDELLSQYKQGRLYRKVEITPMQAAKNACKAKVDLTKYFTLECFVDDDNLDTYDEGIIKACRAIVEAYDGVVK